MILGLAARRAVCDTRAVAIRLWPLWQQPPWGELVAVDLKAGRFSGDQSDGTSEDVDALGIASLGHAAVNAS